MGTKKTTIDNDGVITTLEMVNTTEGPCNITKCYIDGNRVGMDEMRSVATDLLSSGGVVVEQI